MEPATISAIASSVSALAAWFAFGSTTRRSKRDWQRTTALQAAVTILQLCQERHNREHELLDYPGELTQGQLRAAYDRLHELFSKIENAHIQLSLVATPKVAAASRTIVDLMSTLDVDLFLFVEANPGGGTYNGEMYCLKQLEGGRGGVEAAFRRALGEYTTTPTQRLAERLRRGFPKLAAKQQT